jgi:NitT/TauT family transport system substrate-binding protein
MLLLPYLSYAPLFIAHEEGFFTEQRLQVEFVKMSSSATAIASLAQGDLDIIPGMIRPSHFNAMVRGSTIKFVAEKGYTATGGCTCKGFVARRALVESGELKSPAQLKGKKICLDAGFASTEGYFAEKLLEKGGVKLNEVEIIEHIDLAAEREAMRKGLIDLSVKGEPQLTRMVESKHGVLWMGVQEIVPDFQFDIIAFGPTLLQKNPEAGKRFMVAYLKAVRQINRGKTDRNLEILAKYTGLDRELIRKACWPQFRSDGRINVKSIFDFQSWAVKKGLLDTPTTEKQFWDPIFVEYANKVLGASTK